MTFLKNIQVNVIQLILKAYSLVATLLDNYGYNKMSPDKLIYPCKEKHMNLVKD